MYEQEGLRCVSVLVKFLLSNEFQYSESILNICFMQICFANGITRLSMKSEEQFLLYSKQWNINRIKTYLGDTINIRFLKVYFFRVDIARVTNVMLTMLQLDMRTTFVPTYQVSIAVLDMLNFGIMVVEEGP